jgi:glycosyltransferase involved in cell wall biosynthesis
MVIRTTDRRLDILFVCGREPDYIRNWMLRQALARRHHVATATDSVRPAAWRYAQALGKATWHLRGKPDLVLIGFYGQPLMPAMRALTRRPVILDAYVSTYDTLCFDRRWFRPRSPAGRLAFALDLWSCRWADRLLFDTQAHCEYFVHTFGLLPDRAAVVYVGCDETHFTPQPVPLPARTFHVFSVTSFLRLHGVEHILHAAKQLEQQDDILFTIAGCGSHLATMQRLAQELDLHNVRFPGWVPFDELPARIAAADLCLGGHFSDVPKAGRVISTKTFQFLAMGKPTIVGDSPANREVMSHRENAYLCPVADPAALASAILELRNDSLLRQQLGEGGLALYRQRFTTAAIADSLEPVLDGLVT